MIGAEDAAEKIGRGRTVNVNAPSAPTVIADGKPQRAPTVIADGKPQRPATDDEVTKP